jgi:uncharacterized membrane protein
VIAVKYLLKRGGRQLEEVKKHQSFRWIKHTRNVFLAGIIAAIPLVITYLVFRWLFEALDGIFQPVIIFFIGHALPGVGLVAVLLLLYIVGLITTNAVGRRLIRGTESIICRLPIIQYVYSAAKQVVNAVRSLKEVPFKKVVIVEFPKAGMYSLGFVTGQPIDFKGQKKIPLFIPHTPNPMTGFLVLLSAEDILDTDLTIEDAMRMVLSGGLLSPKVITQPGIV